MCRVRRRRSWIRMNRSRVVGFEGTVRAFVASALMAAAVSVAYAQDEGALGSPQSPGGSEQKESERSGSDEVNESVPSAPSRPAIEGLPPAQLETDSPPHAPAQDNPPQAADDRCPQVNSTEPRRRSPSVRRARNVDAECNPLALPEPGTDVQPDIEGIPDRWRVVSMLGTKRNLLDPYAGNNILKGDKP